MTTNNGKTPPVTHRELMDEMKKSLARQGLDKSSAQGVAIYVHVLRMRLARFSTGIERAKPEVAQASSLRMLDTLDDCLLQLSRLVQDASVERDDFVKSLIRPIGTHAPSRTGK